MKMKTKYSCIIKFVMIIITIYINLFPCISIYSQMNFEDKKIIGDQFIRSTDSVGANIAEGYSRFHYLDKVRFTIMPGHLNLKQLTIGWNYYKNEIK